MPVEVGIWRIGEQIQRIVFSPLETERKLEEVAARELSIIDPDLMLVGRQIATSFGKFIDILAIDGTGALVVVELKRSRTPREVVAQALDYGSWVSALSYQDVAIIFAEKNVGKDLATAYKERFGAELETINDAHRLIVVASELDGSTERIIEYLSERFGVPINAILVSYFREGAAEYLTRAWLKDPTVVAGQQRSATARTRDTWNGRDFYVSLGHGERRAWEDCRKYGFISAGGDRWYSRTLSVLIPGARIFVCIPQTGYVGVGAVRSSAVPVQEFQVEEGGQLVPLLTLPLKAPKMGEGASDPDLSEYVVGVEWEQTLPGSQAIWEKGMFANQNSACKLRDRFTLERLIQRFGLDS